MFKPVTYSELCAAMQTRATVQIDHRIGVINAIAAEDGSGRNWIVTLCSNAGSVNVFVRTPAQ